MAFGPSDYFGPAVINIICILDVYLDNHLRIIERNDTNTLLQSWYKHWLTSLLRRFWYEMASLQLDKKKSTNIFSPESFFFSRQASSAMQFLLEISGPCSFFLVML